MANKVPCRNACISKAQAKIADISVGVGCSVSKASFDLAN